MRAACAVARWSIQTTTFHASSPVGLTVTGRSPSPSTTSEHVASNPMPATTSGAAPAWARAPDVVARLLDEVLGGAVDPDGARARAAHRATPVEERRAHARRPDVDAQVQPPA